MTHPGQPARPDPAADRLDAGARRRLPCGADVDELLEQVADGHGDQRTDHQARCVHCQAALADFAAVWAPVAAAADAPVPVPVGVTGAVMAQIRRLADNVWYTFETTEGGSVRVAARVVAVIARDTARRVPGVRVVLGRSSDSRLAAAVEKATLGHRHPHAAVGVLGRTAAVDLAVAVGWGDRAPDVARQIQTAVTAELRRSIGLTGIRVNVTVDDVLPAVPDA